MPTISINGTDFAKVIGTDTSAVVSEDLFGGIAITQMRNTWARFTESSEHIGLNYVRWPGGTASESGYFDPNASKPAIRLVDGAPPAGWVKAYSIDYPDLIHPILISSGAYVGFSTVLEYSVKHNMTLSITIPVAASYGGGFNDEVEHIFSFIQNIFDAHGTDIVNLKDSLIFDIGNEQYSNPQSYATALEEVLTAVQQYRTIHSEAVFRVGVQSMNDITTSRSLISAIKASSDPSVMKEIDIVRHHFLSLGLYGSANIESDPDRVVPVNDLVSKIHAAGRDSRVELFATAFSTSDFDISPTVYGGKAGDDRGSPLSMPAATSLVSLITGFVEQGYSGAAIWGLGALSSQDTVVSYLDGNIRYSPTAEIYRLMAECLPGMTLLSTPTLDDTRINADYFHYAFVDSSKMVILVAADDLPSNKMEVDFNLDNFGIIGSVWADRISVPSGYSGEAESSREYIQHTDNYFNVKLNADFEILMVTVTLEAPGKDKVTIWGSEGADNFYSGSGGSKIFGNDGDDRLHGGAGSDLLVGGGGNDIITGGIGSDILSGGAGSDFFLIERGVNSVLIEDFELGIDSVDITKWLQNGPTYMPAITLTPTSLRVTEGQRILDIMMPPDILLKLQSLQITDLTHFWFQDGTTQLGSVVTLRSSEGVLLGSNGQDTLVASSSPDHFSGGDGFDFVSYSNDAKGLFVDLIHADLNRGMALGDTFTSIQGIIGGDGSDNIRGTLENNVLHGLKGVDWLFGRAGNDVLDGGIGDDVLLGGRGQDTLIGGSGRDRTQYSESLTSVTVDIENPLNNLGEALGDIYISVEDIAAGNFNDKIYGSFEANRLFGRNGNDLLYGRAGNDYLNGGSGKDMLYGGTGDDVLRGGAQADTFVFESGRDIIEDFSIADSDIIQLNSSNFKGATSLVDVNFNIDSALDGSWTIMFSSESSFTIYGVLSVSDIYSSIYFV